MRGGGNGGGTISFTMKKKKEAWGAAQPTVCRRKKKRAHLGKRIIGPKDGGHYVEPVGKRSQPHQTQKLFWKSGPGRANLFTEAIRRAKGKKKKIVLKRPWKSIRTL